MNAFSHLPISKNIFLYVAPKMSDQDSRKCLNRTLARPSFITCFIQGIMNVGLGMELTEPV
jgi:capsule polysaccharide modification protein KpsS